MTNIKFFRAHPEAILPTRKHPKDAGIDLYCIGSYSIKPGCSEIVRTGVSVELPDGCFGLVKPKSKNNYLIGAGVVDQNYRGELLIKVVNYSLDKLLMITKGANVAQLVLVNTIYPEIDEGTTVNINTDRGISGGIVTQLLNELGYKDE